MNSKEILRNYKVKVTLARILILDLFMGNEGSLSAEYIYNECTKKDKTVNLSTVYRTLELFEQICLIDKYDFGNGKYNYIYRRNAHKHVLECCLCHKEIEVECPMKQIEEIIKNKTGFTMVEHELMIKGICDQCKSK